jgi:hypothetical protein
MDERYKLIERETQTEKQSQESLRAFAGWGRSSQLITEVDKILQESQKRSTALSQVITLEEAIKQAPEAEGLAEALAAAQAYLNKLGSEAAQRRSQISQNLMGVGLQEAQKVRPRTSFKTRKFRAQYTEYKAQKPEKIKTLSKIQPFGHIEPLSKLKLLT